MMSNEVEAPKGSNNNNNNNNNTKRAKFLVRTNSKKALGRNLWLERRNILPMVAMLATLYIFLNVLAKADLSVAHSRNLGASLSHVENDQGLAMPQAELGHRRLRAVSSIYNKNSNPVVKVIKDEEWEDHAYLTFPKLDVAEDPAEIWPKVEEKATQEKPSETKEAKTTKKNKKDSNGQLDDATCYAKRYPDLLKGFCNGDISKCRVKELQKHFEEHGKTSDLVWGCSQQSTS